MNDDVHSLFMAIRIGYCHAGAQPKGHFTPSLEHFKTLHRNFDICRNFQRIKMKLSILIMKILYSNSENFRNAVCVCVFILFLAYLLRKKVYIDSRNVNN